MTTPNDFAQLDAQDSVSSFAQMSTEEHAEFQTYLDELEEMNRTKEEA